MGDDDDIVMVDPDGAEVARWPLPSRRPLDLSVVDELARMALAARRQGCTLRVRAPRAALVELLDLAGLRVEVLGQSECRELGGVEEIVMPDDPPA